MDKNLTYRLTLKDYFRKTMLSAAEDTKKLDGSMNKLNKTVEGFGNAAATYVGFSSLSSLGGSILSATLDSQRFSAAIEATSYNVGNANANLRYLNETVDVLGLNLDAARSGYKTFSGAILGTRLQGERGNKVFKQIAGTTAVMGLTAEQTEGAFLALGQMISKGTVQAEELRGQLGERIPGAFQIAARAMGMTTKQLGDAMKDGLIESTEFVEKFGNELQKTFGDKVASASESVQANVNRMSNEWNRLLANFGNSKTGLIKGLTEFGTLFLKEANKVITTTDAMSAAFDRFGAKDFTFIQQKGSMLSGMLPFGMKSNVREMEKLYEWIQKTSVVPSEKDVVSGLGAKSGLLMARAELSKRYANKQVDEDQYRREYAILSDALGKVGDNIDALRRTSVAELQAKDVKKTAAAIGSATEVNGTRPQNINITLERLGDINIDKVENMTETVAEAKQIWSNGLLEVLNDANLMARR